MNKTSTTILAAGMLLGHTYAQQPKEYRPVLPKTAPTEKIIVVNAFKDWQSEDWKEGQSILLTINCLQGLINRESATKVYVTYQPWRLWWNWGKGDEKVYKTHPSVAMLEDGLIPFPSEEAELDESERYPALTYLLRNYGHLIKGQALCPLPGDHDASGARAAAINACVFEDALPVDELTAPLVAAAGLKLPVVADTRKLNIHEAMAWSMDRYLDRPERTKQVVGFTGDLSNMPPVMVDYFVAVKAYCYFMYTRSRHDEDPADPLYDRITDPAVYPQATVHIGCVEGAHAIQRLQKRGHTVICGFPANMSVTSSIPTDPSTFRPAPSADPLPIDPNGAYVSWETEDDGDALDVNVQSMYGRLRLEEALGTYPTGIRVNPYLIDLFPTMYAWFAKHDGVDVIGCMNDGGASYTQTGQTEWVKTYRHYIENSNNSLRAVNYFGIDLSWYLKELNVDSIVAGYMGTPKYPRWEIGDNEAETAWCTSVAATGLGDHMDAMDQILAETDPLGEPIFINGRGKLRPHQVRPGMDRLMADSSIPRRIYWVGFRQLGATYREWVRTREDVEEKTTAELTEDLASDDARVRLFAAWFLGARHSVPPVTVEALSTACQDTNTFVRRRALQALGRHGSPRHAALLVPMLGDADMGALAARALGNVLPAPTPELLSALGSDAEARAVDASEALLTMGARAKSGLPTILKSLATTDTPAAARLRLALTLGSAGEDSADACTALQNILAVNPEADQLLAEASCTSLGAIGTADRDASVAALVALLDRENQKWLRMAAVKGLTELGPEAINALDTVIAVFRTQDHHLTPLCAHAMAAIALTDPRVREAYDWYETNGIHDGYRKICREYRAKL